MLEDLAVAKQNEWRLEQLYAVVNRRYEDRRPLLITADVGTPEALGDHIGHRTALPHTGDVRADALPGRRPPCQGHDT